MSYNIPNHIAIIMDGNGRWAKDRGLPRTAGHKAGIDRIKEIIKAADELGVKVLTFFAFSTENWSRPKKEVDMLMRSLGNFLEKEAADLVKDNIRFRVIGRDNPMPAALQDKIREVEDMTSSNTGLTVVLAVNYGARQEIVDAARKIVASALKAQLGADEIDEDKFRRFLYAPDLADPDLLIRTSGELRISNFLLWQLSYAELYFPAKYWPDFKKKDLELAIAEYNNRQRRFGNISAQQERQG